MKEIPWPKVIRQGGKAVLAATVGSVALCALLGALVWKEIIPVELGYRTAPVLSAALVFLVSCIMAKSVPQGRLVVSLLTAGACVLGAVILKSIVLAQCPLQLDWRIWLVCIAGALAGVTGSWKRTRNYGR